MEKSPAKMTEKISFDLLKQRPLMIVISGVAGVGKDTLVRELQGQGTKFHFVVTMTDRVARSGEEDGKDYFFVSKEKFQEMRNNNELIECAWVYDHWKGIPRKQIEDAINSGLDVVLRVDVQGARSLRKLYGENIVMIFLSPANQEEWEKRLRDRKSESEEQIQKRIEEARNELEQAHIFDYFVVNENGRLCQTVKRVVSIIEAEHLRMQHRKIEV